MPREPTPAMADNDCPKIPSDLPGPIVAGIGASAGGLDAFKKFLAAMPSDSGIAFVLIPHLDPTHESLMVGLLAPLTNMPVVEVKDGMPVEADHVYIIPPNKYMTISDGLLQLTGPVERRATQTSIDLFLRSLAEDRQEKAICIILSGTGSHGTVGLKAVKANGGMAMVQEPSTAEYPSMPESAIASGLADYVLPVEHMPEAVVKYVHYSFVNGNKAEVMKNQDQLNQVLALIRARTKFDFRCYRKAMLARRVERRMGLHHIDRMADYLPYLRGDPEEVKHLVRDLLISVTSFFREKEAFQALQTDVIVPLVEARCSDTPLRIWVPGCATGEEAYSLAMLLLEQLAQTRKACSLQIFATDLDEDALEAARSGVYLEGIAADVSPERLERFFTRMGESAYQVNKQLREVVTFAVQNLISDPPFSKIDLVSCRNVLIYLEPEIQKRVIPLLHFALNEGGYLFLGPSETVGRHIDLFEVLSKKWRTYRRIGPSRLELVEFPITSRTEPLRRDRPRANAGKDRPDRFTELCSASFWRNSLPPPCWSTAISKSFTTSVPSLSTLTCPPASRPRT